MPVSEYECKEIIWFDNAICNPLYNVVAIPISIFFFFFFFFEIDGCHISSFSLKEHDTLVIKLICVCAF